MNKDPNDILAQLKRQEAREKKEAAAHAPRGTCRGRQAKFTAPTRPYPDNCSDTAETIHIPQKINPVQNVE